MPIHKLLKTRWQRLSACQKYENSYMYIILIILPLFIRLNKYAYLVYKYCINRCRIAIKLNQERIVYVGIGSNRDCDIPSQVHTSY